MHGYIVKKSKRQKASNHAGWRTKTGKNAGVKSVMNELSFHPQGEPNKQPESDCRELVPTERPVAVDTFGGLIHVEGDPRAAVTPLGQLPFFTDYLQVSGLFDPWVEECPVQWSSPNAPCKRDVLGTAVLSILCGHQRYAHISALRGDSINAPLLGMEKVASEDSVRATLLKIDEAEGVAWLQHHLLPITEPLLGEPWILDTDVTVKAIYGLQEGAVLGYNPHKPGRPSHTYTSYRHKVAFSEYLEFQREQRIKLRFVRRVCLI